MSSDDTSETNLQQSLCRELLALLARPRDSIDHVADIVRSGERVIQLGQVLRGLGFASDLKELDSDLPGLGIVRVKFLGGADDHALDVVAGHAVGDDDDVERLDCCRLPLGLLRHRCGEFGEIWPQDMCQSCTGGCASQRSDGLEEILDCRGGGDVGIAAVSGVGIAMVEEIDVDTIRVVGGTDRCDGCDGCGCFSPAAACHAPAVVDQKDGVEFA